MNPLSPWWRPAPVLTLLADLIEAELVRLGHPLAASPTLALTAETEFGVAGLALGSLERLDIATAVSVQFGLHQQGLDARLLAGRRLGDWVAAVLSARGLDDGSLCFQTSGSTGKPKPCRHAMETLTQEVAHWAEVFAGRRGVLRAVPCHHIYGYLFAVMLPARLGIPVLDVRTELPAGVLGRARPGDLLVGHPGFFDLAGRAEVSVAMDVLAVTSTAPCPDAVWTRVAAAGVQRFIEVYGASETGGIGQREASRSPFRLLPYWSRVAEDDAALLRRLPDGRRSRVCFQDRLR